MATFPRPRGAPALGLKADNARFAKKYPVKPTLPKPPKVKPIDPNKVATDNAMSAFRTALDQLKASTPAVDANAIRAPYQAASVATGQLGQGLQQSILGVGQQAQQQYGAARDTAQQHAAQFGIAAGSGAQPTALQDTGTGALASQTNAYASAAPMATNAWQQALERSAGAKVADAELTRTQGLTQAQQALSATIPSAIGAEKDRAFQIRTEKFNEGLANSQLDAKQKSELHDYILGNLKLQQGAAHDQTQSEIDAEKLRQGRDKIRISQDALALKRRTTQANAAGLKGIAAATKALSGAQTKPGKKTVPAGWDVDVVSVDEDGEVGTDVKTLHNIKDARPSQQGFAGGVPKTYKIVSSVPATRTAPTSGGSAAVTASQWDAQMRSLLAQNPGRAAEIKRFLGPRPKK